MGALLLVLVIVIVIVSYRKKEKKTRASSNPTAPGAVNMATPTAAGNSAVQGVAMTAQPPVNVTKLRELKGLLDCGVLTQEEYAAQKKQLLSGAPPPYAPTGTGVYPPVPAQVPKVQATPVVQQASVPGSSTQHTNKHTLATDVEILKRELGLNGKISEVVKEAATQLGVDSNGRPLADVSMECVRALGLQSGRV